MSGSVNSPFLGSGNVGYDEDYDTFTLSDAHTGVYIESISAGEKARASRVLLVLSTACLLPWYAVIASSAYLEGHIPHSPSYLQWKLSFAFVAATILATIIVVVGGTRPRFTSRMLSSFVICFIIVGAIPWIRVAWLAISLVAGLGLMAGVQLLTVYGLAAQLGSTYMRPISLGMGFAGVIVPFVDVLTGVIANKTRKNPSPHYIHTADIAVLSSFTCLCLALSLVLYWLVLRKSKLVKLSMDRSADAHTVTDIFNSTSVGGAPFLVLSPRMVLEKLWGVMLALALNYVTTLALILGWGAYIASECTIIPKNGARITCGTALIASAVIADVIGRLLAYLHSLSRHSVMLLTSVRIVVCIIGFALSVRPDLINDWGSVAVYFVFGLSNGYIHSLLFVHGIGALTEENRFMGSNFLVFSMLVGIMLGVGGAAVLHKWYF